MSQDKTFCPVCNWELPIHEAQTCEVCGQMGMCVKCYGSHDCAEESLIDDINDLDEDDLPDVAFEYTDELEDDDEDTR